MALSLESFRERFPEFTDTTDALVQAKLDEAEDRTPTAVWGDKADAGQGYLAAHLLASSPYGRDPRVVNEFGTTTYFRARRDLELEMGPGAIPRVT